MREQLRVGFIGLGDQGAPMARRIAAAGFPLSVWARRSATLEPLADVAMTVEPDVETLGRHCDLVAVCVRDDDDVDELLIGDGLVAVLTPGSIIVNHGTGSPDTACELAELVGQSGVALLDAPVSGGRHAAERGTLAVMVGGAAPAYARARPVFETYASTIVHVGPSGAGQLAKLLNNVVFGAQLRIAEQLLEAGATLGFELSSLIELLCACSGGSYGLEAVKVKIPPEQVDHVQWLIAKDVEHFGRAARRRGLPWTQLELLAEQGIESLARAVELAVAPPT